MDCDIKDDPLIFMLDDDCLNCIFERLPDLRTKVQTARVCKRFHDIIFSSWYRRHLYDLLDLEAWHLLLPDYENFKYFMQHMHEYVKKVVVSNDCLSAFLKDLEYMDITHLPSVTSFYFEPEEFDCYPSDCDMETLTKLMPNLKVLRITQPISGCHISRLKYLEELELYEEQHKDYEIKQVHLEDICNSLKFLRVLDIRNYDTFSELRLHTCIAQLGCIEVLKVNLETLKSVLPAVLQLPRLKKLSVLFDYTFDISNVDNVDNHNFKIHETCEFYDIIATKGANIVSMAVDGYFMPLSDGWDRDLSIHTHKKLQKLAICSWEYNADSLLRFVHMSQLTILCCRNWAQLTDEIVLKFVECCPKLEHLDLSYCNRLTKELPFRALEILKERKQKPLIIYYLLNGFEKYIDASGSKFWMDQRQYIRFSTDFPPNSERGLSYVERGYEFEFE